MKKLLTIFLCTALLLGNAAMMQGCGKSQDGPAEQEASGNPSKEGRDSDISDRDGGAPGSETKDGASGSETGEDEPAVEEDEPEIPSGPACPSVNGALHVEGTQLTDKDGNPVQLRGISTHGLSWFPGYVNRDCFHQLRNEWKANVIRLAMYTAEYGGYCTDGDKAFLKQLVMDGIDHAKSADMYVIVDWHILSDSDPNMYVEEAKAFFQEIAGLYAGKDHILYEICNEPNGGTTWDDIRSYASQVIPVIRAQDEDAVILVGTPNWSQFVDQAAESPITEYDNLMYTLHFYAATHTDDLRAKMTDAVKKGLPVFVSEYGICDAAGSGAIDETQAGLWVEAMNSLNLSYVAWNLSNKEETSAMLRSSCDKTNWFTPDDLSPSGQWVYQMLTQAKD